MPKALQLDKAGRLKLSEADVVRQVCDFLEAHGWRLFRTGYGEIHRAGEARATVGEEFMPDRLCVRYKTGAYCELLWIEFKRKKAPGVRAGKLTAGQDNWIQEERARGATCVVVDDLVEFLDWYRRQGLAKLPATAKVAGVGG